MPKLPNRWNISTSVPTMGRKWEIASYDVSPIGRAGKAKANAITNLGKGIGTALKGVSVGLKKSEDEESKRRLSGGGRGGGSGGSVDTNEEGLDNHGRNMLTERRKQREWELNKKYQKIIKGAPSEELESEEFRRKLDKDWTDDRNTLWDETVRGKGHKSSYVDRIYSQANDSRRKLFDSIDSEVKARGDAAFNAATENKFAVGGNVDERIKSGEPPLSIYQGTIEEINIRYKDDELKRLEETSKLNKNMSELTFNLLPPKDAIAYLKRPPGEREKEPAWTKNLTQEQRDALVVKQEARIKKAEADLKKDIDNANKVLDAGGLIHPQHAYAIRQNAQLFPTQENAQALASIEAKIRVNQNMAGMPVAQRYAHVAAEEAKAKELAKGQITPAQALYFQEQRKAIKKFEEARLKDPIAAAEKENVIPVVVIDPSQKEGLQEALEARKADAEKVALIYGGKPKYLKEYEIKAFRNNTDLSTLNIINEAFGKDAPAVYRELALKNVGDTASSAMGVLGYLSQKVPNAGDLIDDYNAGVKIGKEAGSTKKKKSLEYSADASRARVAQAQQITGNLIPGKQLAAAVHVTENILEARMANNAASEGDFGNIFEQVIGGHEREDGHYGGIGYTREGEKVTSIREGVGTTIMGRPTIVPPNIRTDMFPDVIESIVEEDFNGQPPVARSGDFKDVPLTMDEIQGADLIPAGPGKYRLRVPGEDNEYYTVPGSDGRKDYVLDLNVLEEELKLRVPLAYGIR